MDKARDNEIIPYKILGVVMIICAILMFGLGLLIYLPGTNIRLLKYDYTDEQAKKALSILTFTCLPLLLYGFVLLVFRIKNLIVAYTAILYATLCCGVVCVASKYNLLLAYTLPILASQLFFDKKLTKFSEFASVVVFVVSIFVSAFVFKIYPINTGDTKKFYHDLVRLFVPNFAIMLLFYILFNTLTKRTTTLKSTNNEHIKSMDNRASGMDTLITSSLRLFTTSTLNELNKNIVDICKDVCTPFLENPSDEINVYIGYSDKGNYICKNELGENIRVVKTAETCDIVFPDKEIGIPHTLLHDSPYTKSYGYSNYIELNDEDNKNLFDAQVEKEKEFEKAKLIKNEFTYTFENSKNAIIIRIYSRDYKAEAKEKEKLEAEARARLSKNSDNQDMSNSILANIEPPVILKLIYFAVIDVKLNVDKTLEEFINILTNNIGAALINLNLNLEFLASQREMIYSFSVVTDSRSHHTANHVKRVSEYMKVLCSDPKWGFTEKKIERISIAAMMHDVGKIYIPLEILDKKSGLTDEEFNVIKSHVTRGAELIAKCPGDIMRYAKVMISDHHERWDGRGYLKKKGTQIDLLGRIIAVADVFDALMSPRPYKESWPKDKVRDTIIHDKGHFDPQVIAVFTNRFDQLVKVYEDNKDEEIR